MLAIPIPRLEVDQLPQHAQTTQVPLLHVVRSEMAQQADGGGVDLSEPVGLDGLSVSRGALEVGCGDAVNDGPVSDVGVPYDPADIGMQEKQTSGGTSKRTGR
jgi:hypothetical protein